MAKRRAPQEFIRDITASDDGVRPVRSAKIHTREKLGILTSYLASYGRACRTAGEFSFVDALSGPGMYRVEETNEWLLGSTMIALRSEPRFGRCLAMDLNAENVRALRERTASDQRAVVLQGDCNRDLLPAMANHVRRDKPLFVLLDPEGAEVEWHTIQEISGFRAGPLKAEMLILFSTEGVNRMLPVEQEIEAHNEMRLNRLFPPTVEWRTTWQQRRAEEITPADARERYVEIYRRGCEALGYQFTETRPVRRTNGAVVYHLIFASDHPAGKRIMSDVFGSMHPNDPQLPLL
jgi:three-Cys-motif partner protein